MFALTAHAQTGFWRRTAAHACRPATERNWRVKGLRRQRVAGMVPGEMPVTAFACARETPGTRTNPCSQAGNRWH